MVHESAYDRSRGRLADILVYRCGFAAEKKGKRQISETEFEHYREVAPLAHAIQNVRTVLDSFERKFDKLEVFLSGKRNFRTDLATIKTYKGNRSPFSKPVHYEELRDYLTSRYDATVTDGIEADDAIGLRATDGASSSEDVCIISTDKDLKQIPGHHYNWVKDEAFEIDEAEGLRVFYRQLLTGDSVDNIPGVDGIGPVNAARIVNHYSKESGMWQAVANEYNTRYPDGYPTEHGTVSVSKALSEIGMLLWIQRTGRLTWQPPS